MKPDSKPFQAPISRRELLTLIGCGIVTPLQTACSRATEPNAKPETVPVYYQSLAATARLIETRKISPTELTQLMLTRIGTLDKSLHGYATVMVDQAMASARAADDEIRAGRYRGPLHGMPIAVKDLCYTKGVRTMGGLSMRRDFIPEYDATVVTKLEAAGAVLLGKLNLTEGAMVGYHRDFDIPVNPWGENLWSGVSSSGSGVATAAGLCFGSLGTDTGGSIRFPAMANGIVGLKPTYGRVSRYGVLPLAESLDHVGPMTRSVTDAAIMFQAIAGHDPNDPTSLDVPEEDVLGDLDRGIEGLRIGLDHDYALEGIVPGLAKAIQRAVRELEQLGATIVDIKVPDVSEVLAAWPALCAAEAVEAHREFYPAHADEYGDYFRQFLDFGATVSAEEVARIRQLRESFSEQFKATLAEVDAIISPSGGEPFEVEPGLQYGSMADWAAASAQRAKANGMAHNNTPFTFPHDFAGTPTLTLPCGVSDYGVPYSMQLAGSALSEAMLCRIGYAYEQATEWHRLRPEI